MERRRKYGNSDVALSCVTMSHGPGCGGEAVIRVQGRGRKENKVKAKREQGRVIVQVEVEGVVIGK